MLWWLVLLLMFVSCLLVPGQEGLDADADQDGHAQQGPQHHVHGLRRKAAHRLKEEVPVTSVIVKKEVISSFLL